LACISAIHEEWPQLRPGSTNETTRAASETEAGVGFANMNFNRSLL
jgi:hypothetical protein